MKLGKKPPKPKRNPKAYKLRSKGVADKEKFIRGCMAFVGLLFLVFFAALVYSFFFGGS